jgi:hypothetical protein
MLVHVVLSLALFFLSAPVILVTGGSGLVGMALKAVSEMPEYHVAGERWVFLSSKDGDLRCVCVAVEGWCW